MKRLNGVHLSHRKHTEDHLTELFPTPKSVQIPMQMHIGAPCKPLVKIGDYVTVGQKIGEPLGEFSVPIHSSVSGTVTEIVDFRAPNGSLIPSLVIVSDGEQAFCPDLAPPKIHSKEDLAAAARESGCVGLGGAGFPTHIKLAAKQPIDTLVINAAECEPFITSDCRQIMEFPEDIIQGIQLVMKHLHIKSCRIGIEENKPAAIKRLADCCRNLEHIEVRVLPALYPQGAEKVIVYHTTGRIVPEGKLTADVGVLVLNVSTCAFLYQYTQTGIPLTQRRVTVDGDAVGRPCNLMVHIGTSIRDILAYAQYDPDQVKQLMLGGPMMGVSLPSPDMPLCKQHNAVLAFTKTKQIIPTACIRCGKCMDACPMNLMPMELERAYRAKDSGALEEYRLHLCISCGCCSFVCPAKRPLTESMLLAKNFLLDSAKKGESKE